jgi:hypothetical protein
MNREEQEKGDQINGRALAAFQVCPSADEDMPPVVVTLQGPPLSRYPPGWSLPHGRVHQV